MFRYSHFSVRALTSPECHVVVFGKYGPLDNIIEEYRRDSIRMGVVGCYLVISESGG